MTGPISKEEKYSALETILKLIQLNSILREFHDLNNNRLVSKTSCFYNLNPFLENGIIKVGGRLVHTDIPESQKFPAILPKNNHVTNLIIRDEHKNRMHVGITSTLYGIREQYWIIIGRSTVRNIIRQFVKCFKVKPREIRYLMGNLPKERTSFSRPFLQIGVDFCGPLNKRAPPQK